VAAEAVPHEAFVRAVLAIHTRTEAEWFLSGHLHWLQGRRPRTIEEVLLAAKANIAWCFEEQMPSEEVEMWTSLWSGEMPIAVPTKSPEETFRAAQAVGEKIKAGKDPGGLAALARKALEKKKGGV